FIYWATPDGLMKVSKNGVEPQMIYQTRGQEVSSGLVLDADNIYFTTGTSRHSLYKLSKKGGEPQKVTERILSTHQFALDDKDIYFFDEEDLLKDALCKVAK